MPSKTDPDTSHDATETHPDPSGVSVRGSRHPIAAVRPFALRKRFMKSLRSPPTLRPDVNDDQRSVDTGDGPGAVLHAKAVVHDNDQVFVTSANLTTNALDRNIEAGVLVRDRSLAQALAAHFQRLIDTSLVVPLPPVP